MNEQHLQVAIDAAKAGAVELMSRRDNRVVQEKAPRDRSGGTLKFDSADGEEPDSPMWQMMKPMVRAMQNGQGNFRVSPLGVVSDFRPTKELAARLAKDPTMAAILTSGQLESVAQSLFAHLPENPVKRNETWNEVTDRSPTSIPNAPLCLNCSIGTT